MKETSYDVIVVGAGVAGVAAALEAARAGLSTALIEKTIFTGGLATTGLVNIYLPLCDGRGTQVSFGIAEELLQLSLKYGPGDIPAAWRQPDPRTAAAESAPRVRRLRRPADGRGRMPVARGSDPTGRHVAAARAVEPASLLGPIPTSQALLRPVASGRGRPDRLSRIQLVDRPRCQALRNSGVLLGRSADLGLGRLADPQDAPLRRSRVVQAAV